MKKLLFILFITFLASPLYATTYFAQDGSGNMSTRHWDTTAGGGGTDLVWANRAAGDLFVANGQTGIAIDVDPGVANVAVTITTAGNGGTDGGTFTYATATNVDLHLNTVAGTTDCLAVSGSTGKFNQIGNNTGGAGTGIEGVISTHTTITATTTGTNTGGAGTSAHGYSSTGTGATTHTGSCTAGATYFSAGCNASGTGAITVVGNIVSGTRQVGALGAIVWNPTAPSNGVTGHYVKFDGGGTAKFAGTNTDDATKALATFYYIDPTDGTSDVGTATGGSGGSYGF